MSDETTGRVKISTMMGRWLVACEVCNDINFLSMFRPWITAGNHKTAITLARWHIAQHEARTCDHCHRTDALETPQLVDQAHFNFDGKLYEIRSTGVIAIGTAVSKVSP